MSAPLRPAVRAAPTSWRIPPLGVAADALIPVGALAGPRSASLCTSKSTALCFTVDPHKSRTGKLLAGLQAPVSQGRRQQKPGWLNGPRMSVNQGPGALLSSVDGLGQTQFKGMALCRRKNDHPEPRQDPLILHSNPGTQLSLTALNSAAITATSSRDISGSFQNQDLKMQPSCDMQTNNLEQMLAFHS